MGPSTAPRLKLLSFFQYADPVTDLLDRCGVFRARLFRESCVFHQGCYVKDLSHLGRDLKKKNCHPGQFPCILHLPPRKCSACAVLV